MIFVERRKLKSRTKNPKTSVHSLKHYKRQAGLMLHLILILQIWVSIMDNYLASHMGNNLVSMTTNPEVTYTTIFSILNIIQGSSTLQVANPRLGMTRQPRKKPRFLELPLIKKLPHLNITVAFCCYFSQKAKSVTKGDTATWNQLRRSQTC